MKLRFDKAGLVCELVAGKDVLDIGCVDHSLDVRSKGRWLHERIRSVASSTVGLDYERDEIKKLKSEGYDVVFADAVDFDIDRKFDVVVAGDILEHLVNPAGFFASVKRHLRPNGKLILTTPNANCILYFIENILLGFELDNTDHVSIFTPTTMGKMLEKCGFKGDKYIFISMDCSHYQVTFIRKFIAKCMFFVQSFFGFFRPSLCRHFLTVSSVAGGEGVFR